MFIEYSLGYVRTVNNILWVWQRNKLLNGLHFCYQESPTKWAQSRYSAYNKDDWKVHLFHCSYQFSLLLYLLNPILYSSMAINMIFMKVCPFLYVVQSLPLLCVPRCLLITTFPSSATLFFICFLLERFVLVVPVTSEYCGKGPSHLYRFLTVDLNFLTPPPELRLEELFLISFI